MLTSARNSFVLSQIKDNQESTEVEWRCSDLHEAAEQNHL